MTFKALPIGIKNPTTEGTASAFTAFNKKKDEGTIAMSSQNAAITVPMTGGYSAAPLPSGCKEVATT